MPPRTALDVPGTSYDANAILSVEQVAEWLRLNIPMTESLALPVARLGPRLKRYVAGQVVEFIARGVGRDVAATARWLRDSDRLTIRAALTRPPFRLAGVGKRIYIIRRPDTGEVKIGISQDVNARCAQLQRAHGSRLELVVSLPGTLLDEREAHERFAAHRLNAEWFREAPEVTEWIEGLAHA